MLNEMQCFFTYSISFSFSVAFECTHDELSRLFEEHFSLSVRSHRDWQKTRVRKKKGTCAKRCADVGRKYLKVFWGVIVYVTQRQRSMRKWKHEPSLFHWTLLHLHTQTHTHTAVPVLYNVTNSHTHRCLHSTLKTIPSTTLLLPFISHTLEKDTCYSTRCVCVCSPASNHV